jgi:hypothetical protein
MHGWCVPRAAGPRLELKSVKRRVRRRVMPRWRLWKRTDLTRPHTPGGNRVSLLLLLAPGRHI